MSIRRTTIVTLAAVGLAASAIFASAAVSSAAPTADLARGSNNIVG